MFSRPSPRTSSGHRPFWTARLSAALLVAAAGLYSVGWQPAALLHAEGPTERGTFRDVYHTMLARKALLQDGALAPLNIGVRVQDRVAILWGPVPSQEVMRRAVEVLRKVPDLIDVRNEMHVETPEDPRPQFLPESGPNQPPAQAPAVQPPPPQLPGFSREDAARGVLTLRPAAAEAVTPAGNLRLPPGFPTPNGEDQAEPVLPSIAVPQAGPARPAGPAAPGWSSLQLAVNALRFADTRFQGLHAEARDGQVLLSGSAASWDDVRDFAAGLNRLPGVERVILGQVRAER